LCFNAADGSPLWSHKYEVKYGTLGGYNNGPRSAPTFHDGKLYTLGAVGHLFCFDAVSGKIVWSKDTVKELNARVPEWGFAASPVIDGDKVIVHVGAEPGGCYVALDRLTGKEIWRAGKDPAGYGTPIVIDARGGRQLVGWTPEHVCGFDVATGKQLWQVPYKVTYGVSIATPIFQEDMVFVTGYWDGSRSIRLGPKATDFEVVGQDRRELRGLMAQPLYRDGFVYTIDKGNGLTCVELKTGKKRWDDENRLTPRGRNPHASIVWLGDTGRILALNSVGELILAKVSPEGYDEQSRVKVIDGQVWGHPGFSGRHMFLRNDGAERMGKGPFELICLELVGKP
jgi:outer membrane protein assembly factor BamB